VLYDLNPVTYQEPRSFRELIKDLASLELRVQVRCDATFMFPTASWKSVFKLPWQVFERDASMPFDEVRGVRVAKHTNGQTLWSGIIDLLDENYVVNTRYTSVGILNDGLFAETLARGIEIAGRVIRPLEER
jgi:hypothetical protein